MTQPSALVFILTADPNSPSAQNLAQKFPTPYFDTQFAQVENPTNSTGWTQDRTEAYRIKAVLNSAAQSYPNLPVLIVKDNALTTFNSSDIQNLVAGITARPNWSYANLASYNNLCTQLSNPQTLTNGTRTYDVPSTNGNSALLISPSLRDILIGKTLNNNQKPIVPNLSSLNNTLSQLTNSGAIVKPIIISPNVFNYDPTKPGKSSYCAGDGASSGGGWGIGLLFLALLILLFLFLFMRKRRS